MISQEQRPLTASVSFAKPSPQDLPHRPRATTSTLYRIKPAIHQDSIQPVAKPRQSLLVPVRPSSPIISPTSKAIVPMPSFYDPSSLVRRPLHASSSVTRLPNTVEFAAISAFAHHTDHCLQCSFPLELLDSRSTLCRRGSRHALELVRHLCSRDGKIHSIYEEGNTRTVAYESNSIRVTMPRGCDMVSDLLRAVEDGLELRRSGKDDIRKEIRAVILHDALKGKSKEKEKEKMNKERWEYSLERQTTRNGKRVTLALVRSKSKDKSTDIVRRRKSRYDRPVAEIVEAPSGWRSREERVVYVDGSGYGGLNLDLDRFHPAASLYQDEPVNVVYAAPRESRGLGRYGTVLFHQG